jgi:hypothetical protein
MAPSTDDVHSCWAFLRGERHVGCIAVTDGTASSDAVGLPFTIDAERPHETLLDVQLFQLTLKASHPQILPPNVSTNADVNSVFGGAPMQACVTSLAERRTEYVLVGSGHHLAAWLSFRDDESMSKQNLAPQELHREYYVPELHASEKAWLPAVFEPFREAYLPSHIFDVFLSDEPLPHDAQAAILQVRQRNTSGLALEVVCYRARRMVVAYGLESHGRRWYRSLEYSSDARFSLRSLQPDTQNRDYEWASWARHEAGNATCSTAGQEQGAAVVITRPWSATKNLSLGTETFLPQRLCHGLLPEALLATHEFWQAEDDEIRGYPHDDSDTNILLINVSPSGHVALHGVSSPSVPLASDVATTMPTRAIVLRLKRERCQKRRDDVVDALRSLERFCAATPDLLSTAFTSSFELHQEIATLLESGDMRFFASFDELLNQTNVVALLCLAPKMRTAAVLLPRIVSEAAAAAQRDVALAGGATDDVEMGKAGEQTVTTTTSASDVEASELVLLDLLHAPPDSHLFSLATAIARVETLSHVCAWARWDANVDLRHPTALSQSDVWLITLPRMKLTVRMHS